MKFLYNFKKYVFPRCHWCNSLLPCKHDFDYSLLAKKEIEK